MTTQWVVMRELASMQDRVPAVDVYESDDKEIVIDEAKPRQIAVEADGQ